MRVYSGERRQAVALITLWPETGRGGMLSQGPPRRIFVGRGGTMNCKDLWGFKRVVL